MLNFLVYIANIASFHIKNKSSKADCAHDQCQRDIWSQRGLTLPAAKFGDAFTNLVGSLIILRNR